MGGECTSRPRRRTPDPRVRPPGARLTPMGNCRRIDVAVRPFLARRSERGSPGLTVGVAWPRDRPPPAAIVYHKQCLYDDIDALFLKALLVRSRFRASWP